MKICLATNNKHKIEEISAVLGPEYHLVTLNEMGFDEVLPETGTTLEENSLQKAKFIFEKYKIPCLADDSGLEIDALDGRPGVDSAHYAGPQRDSLANLNLVLDQIAGKENRNACFKTVLTFLEADGTTNQFVGRVDGQIVDEPKGANGFGYDPIFVPNNYTKSFAELEANVKNTISHRAEALKVFVDYLEKSK